MESSFRDKNVFITGHTGFKGGWLSLWLWQLGARITGYSLPAEHPKGQFFAADIESKCNHIIGDVRDYKSLFKALSQAEPEVVFHLAAQPLVLESYRTPRDTFDTNVMGTVNLLEAVRQTPSVKAIVIITSDKCYENQNKGCAFREGDRLGGHDPYSGSKAACEVVTNSYWRSFFQTSDVGIATARAGNVIGGGDWAADRILPDCYRSLLKSEDIVVRNPHAIRPWQHVLEPISGYLLLASKLLKEPKEISGPWNFGPTLSAQVPVGELVNLVLKEWKGGQWQHRPSAVTEAKTLHLDITKAQEKLGWHPTLSIEQAVAMTGAWYRNDHLSDSFSLKQIEEFVTRTPRGAASSL